MLNFPELCNLHQSKKAYFFSCLIYMVFAKQKIQDFVPRAQVCRQTGSRRMMQEGLSYSWSQKFICNFFLSLPSCRLLQALSPPIISSQSSGCKSRTADVVPLKEVGAFHCRIYMGWGCPRGRETECSGVSRSYFLKQRRKGKLWEEASLFLALNTLIGGKGS